MITRRGLLRGGAGFGLGVGGLGAWGFVIEPFWRLTVQHQALTPPGWPAGARLRVAALADIHACIPAMTVGRMEEIVAAANALRPDIVLLLGDYGASSRYILRRVPHAEVARTLAGLRAPLGVHAVNGNHDWWEDGRAQLRRSHVTSIARAFDAAGIGTLRNEARRLVSPGGTPFWLAGLESSWAFGPGRGVHDLPGTLGQVTDDAPVLLLAHEPDIFPDVPDRVSLTLSGHTHGGQVKLFGRTPFIPSAFGTRYLYGRIEEEGRTVIVSSGLGTTLAPVRFGVPPEILLVELGAQGGPAGS